MVIPKGPKVMLANGEPYLRPATLGGGWGAMHVLGDTIFIYVLMNTIHAILVKAYINKHRFISGGK